MNSVIEKCHFTEIPAWLILKRTDMCYQISSKSRILRQMTSTIVLLLKSYVRSTWKHLKGWNRVQWHIYIKKQISIQLAGIHFNWNEIKLYRPQFVHGCYDSLHHDHDKICSLFQINVLAPQETVHLSRLFRSSGILDILEEKEIQAGGMFSRLLLHRSQWSLECSANLISILCCLLFGFRKSYTFPNP